MREALKFIPTALALVALMILPMMLLRARYLTVDEHRELFTSAGFSDIDVHTDARKGWICVVGRKPGVDG